jgi:putative phosphoribosyl transferase
MYSIALQVLWSRLETRRQVLYKAYMNETSVRIDPPGLEGIFAPCAQPKGLVIFAHGSGSGRFSPRNNFVAAGLRQAGCATLLPDLLTPAEETIRAKVFDIRLLADRLKAIVSWVRLRAETAPLPIGLFGASTGAGAALLAAAELQTEVCAVVSRGGRPDLADTALPQVKAPTLLIVGGLDTHVIELNRYALSKLSVEKEMSIVPGAGHLFEEPGTLEEVLQLAAGWFVRHFPADVHLGDNT